MSFHEGRVHEDVNKCKSSDLIAQYGVIKDFNSSNSIACRALVLPVSVGSGSAEDCLSGTFVFFVLVVLIVAVVI